MTSFSEIEQWVVEGIDAGHPPVSLFREMCRGGWSEAQALQVIETALAGRVKALGLPLDRDLIDRLPCFPYVNQQFLQPAELARLCHYAQSHERDFGPLLGSTHFWSGRILLPDQIHDQDIVSALRSVRDRVIAEITALLAPYSPGCPTIYADVINFARWPVGYSLEPHADRENPDGSVHPYPWRDFAAVIYLNTDFQGGQVYFPELDIRLSPEAGSLLMFPGSLKFLHGVSTVTEGMRHTLATFLTFDSAHEFKF